MLTRWSQVATRGSCRPFHLHVTFWARATPAGHPVLLQRPHMKPLFPCTERVKVQNPIRGRVDAPGVRGRPADIDRLRHVTWSAISACRFGWLTSTVATRIIMDFMSDRDAQKVSVNFTFAGKAAERRAVIFVKENHCSKLEWNEVWNTPWIPSPTKSMLFDMAKLLQITVPPHQRRLTQPQDFW